MEMEIKVLGADCSKCNTLFGRFQNIVELYRINAKVVKISDAEELAQYNVYVVPAIIINNEVVSKGIVLSETEIIALINKYLPESQQIIIPVQKKARSVKWLPIIIVLAIISAASILLTKQSSDGSTPVVNKDPLSLQDSIDKMYNYSVNKLPFKLTFLEFGSDKCIPCKRMEVVMEEIDRKYQGVVNTVFYNVTRKENDAMADFFKIEIIPAQVLLDGNGREFFRHIGYFPTDSLSGMIDGHLKNNK